MSEKKKMQTVLFGPMMRATAHQWCKTMDPFRSQLDYSSLHVRSGPLNQDSWPQYQLNVIIFLCAHI